MPILIPELEDVAPAIGRQRRPKHVLHGRRAKAAKKALGQILVLFRQDTAEALKAEKLNQTPLLVTGEFNSPDQKAFKKVIDRLKAMIALKL